LTAFEGPVSRQLATSRKLSHRGVGALERGDARSAATLLHAAVESCPADAEAHRHYAEALWQLQEPDKALAQMDAALKLTPDDDALHVRAGQMRLETGDIEGASDEANQALHLNPKAASAWTLRGQVSHRRGDLRQALNDFNRALGYAPEDCDVLLASAEVYRELNQPQRALISLQNLADSYAPGEEPQRLLYLEGLAYHALGRYDEAASTLLAARQRGPNSADLQWRVALSQQAAGRYDLARQSVDEALALDPLHPGSRALADEMSVARMPASAQMR
jgi:tetratricopeptide (TPR) repeat protein